MKNNRRTNLDMGTLALTGIISVILAFSLLLLAAIITDTDITLWDKSKAIPLFIAMSGLLWWYFWSGARKKETKALDVNRQNMLELKADKFKI